MRNTSMNGASPQGASVTSGTVSTFGAITAGHIILNGVTFPVVPAVASAAARVDQLIARINSYTSQTGVVARKVTTTTYKLEAGVAITATLGATATVASCGFVTAINASLTPVILATRRALGTGANTGNAAIVQIGNQWIDVKSAKAMGYLAEGVSGAEVELQTRAAYTVTTR